ncbi:uncharacterized protein LOC114579610 [Dendrobium catenatum]|uniref:uncharacterized protein LOC114579610 n=1 Tax=Dendrobium catenatum TaxID=906689 RepID=UPI00109FBDC3|nr:uncharacterized protein LOC114579610 [Dendrobium catenatum]
MPICIEAEMSDSENLTEVKSELAEVEEDNPPVTSSEEIVQIKLRRDKVLPPYASSEDKGKQVVDEPASSLPPQPVPFQSLIESGMPKVDYNVLAHLRKLPVKLSIYDALILFKEMREALIKAMLDLDICMTQLAAAQPDEALCSRGVPEISFSDEDLCLGTADHNHPLYITVNIDNFRLSRILVDPGTSVNIMTLRTLVYLRIDVHKLSSDKIIFQGFNENGERALG